MDPTIIAAVLGPIALDIVRSLKDKFFPAAGDYKPASMAEWVEMQRIRLEQFKLMRDGGTPIGVLWADVFLRLQVPALATISLFLFFYQETFLPEGATENMKTLTAAFCFWLLGDEGKNAIATWKSKRNAT